MNVLRQKMTDTCKNAQLLRNIIAPLSVKIAQYFIGQFQT